MATMEQRMSTVEQDVSSIKATLEHLATKSDIANLKSELMWWMFWLVIGTTVAIASVLVAVFLVAENLAD
jgi:hypothetical protein